MASTAVKPKSQRVLKAQAGKTSRLEQAQLISAELQFANAEAELRTPLFLNDVNTNNTLLGEMSQHQGEQCLKKYKALQTILQHYTNNVYSLWDMLYGVISKQAGSHYSLKHGERITNGTCMDEEIFKFFQIINNKQSLPVLQNTNIVNHNQLSITEALLQKDLLTTSNNAYTSMKVLSGKTSNLPPLYKVQKEKGIINQQIETDLEVKAIPHGAFCSVTALLKNVAKQLKAMNKVPKFGRYLLKFSLDGSSLKGLLVLAMNIINSEAFGAQESSSIFQIMLIKAEEKENTIEPYLKVIGAEVKNLIRNGFKLSDSERQLYIDALWSSDLKAAKLVFKNSGYNERDCVFHKEMELIENHFGIKIIIPCILHLKQRVTEAMVVHTAAHNQSQFETFMQNDMQCAEFSFQKKQTKNRQQTFRCKMIKGKICNEIVEKRKLMLDRFIFMDNNGQKVRNLWDKWAVILTYLEKPNPTQVQYVSGKWKDELEKLNEVCKEFHQLWKERWGNSVSHPFYLHVLSSHVINIMKKYGSLVVFSSQILERCHSLNLFSWERASPNGGGKPRKYKLQKHTALFAEISSTNLPNESFRQCVEDIFLRQLRIVYLQTIIAEDLETEEVEEKQRKIKYLPQQRKRNLRRDANTVALMDVFEYGIYRVVDKESSYYTDVASNLHEENQSSSSNTEP